MNAHVAVSETSSIQSLLDLLSGISVGESYVSPGGSKKCSHFKAFGKPDDFTRRIITHLSDLTRECDQFVRNFKKKDLHDKIDTVFADDETAQKSGIDAVQEQQRLFDVEFDTRMRRITYVTNLLHEEIIRQFPEADNKVIDHLFVDDDWTVGWLDHTKLDDEIFETLMGGDQTGNLDEVMAVGPDGKMMSVDEVLKSYPPEVAEAIRSQIGEVVGRIHGSSQYVPRSGRDFGSLFAALAARVRRPRG